MFDRLGHTVEVKFHHDGFEFNDGTKPLLNFDVQQRIDRYEYSDKVLYLERDPRDVMVSLYYQVTGRFRDFFNYSGDISEFIRDPYFGANNLRRFREMWAEVVAEKGFLKITYEDLHENCFSNLKQALSYLGLPATDYDIECAVNSSTIEKMRAVEEKGEFAEPWLRKRNGSAKVRRGIVGGFQSDLAIDDIEYLNRTFGIIEGSSFQ